MYDEITHDCICGKCGHQWRSRGGIPAVCSKCTSRLWNSTDRKFSVIVSKLCADDPEKLTFCIIPYVDMPSVQTDDVFYVSHVDFKRYFQGKIGINSAVTMIGSFSIGEDKMLDIEDMNLVYTHPANFISYADSIVLSFNKRSAIEKQKEIDRRNKQEAERALREKEEQEKVLEFAKQKLLANAGRYKEIEEAEKKVLDETIPVEERIKALDYLKRV
jgi:hypothetical protein